MPVPGDDTRARCRYCRLLLRAHYSDLRNHARTTKHASNVAFGRPCNDLRTASQVSSRSTNKALMMSGRRKKSEAGDAIDDPLSLDRPDDSLASLKSLANLAQFGWDEPRGPETTLILHNGMHLDERLAASLPQTPGLRFRVKKEPLSTGYDHQTSTFGKKRKDKVNSSSSVVSTEEISDDMLKHLARSVTLWEFLMLKVNRGRPGTDRRVKVADMLTEFGELHKKVKHISRQMLTPLNESTDSSDEAPNKRNRKTLMLESKELAMCLGLSTGRYEINQSAELADSALVDCRPLIPPLRRRIKPAVRDVAAVGGMSTNAVPVVDYMTSGLEMAGASGTELRQYVIEQSADVDSQSVLQGHVIDGAGQQLVLVAADSGELLLQCDLKDYHNIVQSGAATGFTTLDDFRSLVGMQSTDVSSASAVVAAADEIEFAG